MIDELSEIGEAGGYIGVVSRSVARSGILHRIGEFVQRTVVDGQRLECRKHPAEHAGIIVSGQRIQKLPRRLTSGFAVTGLNVYVGSHRLLLLEMLKGRGATKVSIVANARFSIGL